MLPVSRRSDAGPTGTAQSRVSLFSERFASAPHEGYRYMRETYGSIAPVWLAPGVAATLVVEWQAAVRILNDPEHFPADPTRWEKTARTDSPVFEVLRGRRNALRCAGVEHSRYRATIKAALAEADRFKVEQAVERAAESLIGEFHAAGSADLRAQYALPLTVRVMCELLGLTTRQAHQVWAEMAAMMDGVPEAGERFGAALYEAVTSKRAHPAQDMMSRLIQHEHGLDDIEVVEQTALLLGPGTETTCNLITNAVLIALTDERFAGGLHGGSLVTRDAIDEVLFTDTPLPNFCITYPRQPQLIDDVWLPADEPVVISMAACNSDPALEPTRGFDVIDRWGNRSHLSWGAGPHACPAQDIAGIIVQRAIDQLFDVLPDLRLPPDEVPRWRSGPFHRAVVTLPVVFPPAPAVFPASP
ncbi:cytochrome P450 [Nocardia noduli]|uniref:cytochrome P450 n=1 Tax=Nocardia noduli TaxID=2815722 RepID=UPI0027DEB6DC|nr:cytochrome P450 [Nocardia noduli]